MEALAVLMLISLVVAAGFLIAFLRMVNRGGLEDLVSPSVKMLQEEARDTPNMPRTLEEKTEAKN